MPSRQDQCMQCGADRDDPTDGMFLCSTCLARAAGNVTLDDVVQEFNATADDEATE